MRLTDLPLVLASVVWISCSILLIQAVPEALYWLVVGDWYGLRISYIVPAKFIDFITSTSFVGLNRSLTFISEIWISAVVSGAFAIFATVTIIFFGRFRDDELVEDLMNPVVRAKNLLRIHQELEQLASRLDDVESTIRISEQNILNELHAQNNLSKINQTAQDERQKFTPVTARGK